MFLLYVCVHECEELTVTAGWWLAQRPTDAGISASAINSVSLSCLYTHTYESRVSIMEAAV